MKSLNPSALESISFTAEIAAMFFGFSNQLIIGCGQKIFIIADCYPVLKTRLIDILLFIQIVPDYPENLQWPI